MKNVILSSDGEVNIYSVPDEVADDLEAFCLKFSADWLWKSPDAAKYRKEINGRTVACYTELDFINYLNKWIFPETPSVLVKNLGCYDHEVPDEYKDHPRFNF